MLPSNFQGGGVSVSRVPFSVIIMITALIADENGWNMMPLVEGRTWPRILPKEGFYHKEEIYSASSPSTSPKKDYNTSYPSSSFPGEMVTEAPKSEINSSLSPILPSPLHLEKALEDDADNNSSSSSRSSTTSNAAGDYQDFNGNVSLRCNRHPRHHHYHHRSGNSSSTTNGNNNDDYNGEGRWWWTSNSTNCQAGPFHLGADVNESVFSALCPLSASTTNGKFPIKGLHCGDGGEWYTECSHNKELSSSTFTIHKCDDGQSFLGSEVGGCARKSTEGKMETSATACPMDRDETNSDDGILRWVLLQTITPAQIPEESRVRERTAHDLQSLEEEDDSKNNDDDNGQIENLCKSTSYHHGIHSHPQFCTKYIQCTGADGSFVVRDCGPGTVFNPKQLVCDWAANVPQCNRGNENLRRRRRTVDATSKESGLLERKNICDFIGIRADPQFCNKYRLCSNGGVESVHTCGLGAVFNPLSGVCDFADEVDCSSRKSDLGTFGCDEGDKYRAPHPDYCNKFVECQEATLAVKSCPPGTLYDREAENCDHAFKVTCRKPISLEHDIDVNWKSHGHDDGESSNAVVIKRKRRNAGWISTGWRGRNTRNNNNNNQLNLACEFNYIAPHPRSCNRFVECEDRRIYVKTCGPGTAFNPILGQCDWPHNVREPDSQDCTRYRQCSLRQGFQTRSCQPGQIFDEETRKCVRGTPYQVQRCRLTTTPQTPGFIAPPPS